MGTTNTGKMKEVIMKTQLFRECRQLIYIDMIDEREWLETSEGDEVECVSIENAMGIVDKRLAELEKLIQQQ